MSALSELFGAGFLKRGFSIMLASLALWNGWAGVNATEVDMGRRVVSDPVANHPVVTDMPAAGDALTDELVSVRALMRMEMALALDQARRQSERLKKRNNMRVGESARLELPPSELRMTALYGTGRNLVAEVQTGVRTLTYINGKAWPVGVTSGETVYRLIGIKGRCLTLARQGKTQRVCMDANVGGEP
ncbi:MAG TPA: hypothetical protein DEB15_01410 [Pusillimonas sp.]|jgi:hypothetical protein|nr:hypothetical protein [Pusillimonas sp.]MBC42334.1 hypothetical protein [Pusillimonas sp.]HBT31568.1 hypothetical protein [Pusillimonas sp.]HCP76708.1 hypothetical protein [Pusillimonas sp.]|tara:strand:- start:146155 stop:146721 length:567 start_codon:yes stop_codon:yes gene_type:complete